MRKLGLVREAHAESDDFARYLDLLKEGLLEEQAQLVHEQFMNRVPPSDEGTEVEEAE
jgi:hypothetical protein